MYEAKEPGFGLFNPSKNRSKNRRKNPEENIQKNSPGGRKTKCCPTTKKGDGGFMNILCQALGCCGLLSACYEPPTPQPKV